MKPATLLGSLILASVTPAVIAGGSAPPRPKPTKVSAAPPLAWKPASLELCPGERSLVELFIPGSARPTPGALLKVDAGTGLTYEPDKRYKGTVARWGAKLFPLVRARADAPVGDTTVTASFGTQSATLKIQVQEPEIRVTTGIRMLTVAVTNPFKSREIVGRIGAQNKDRFLENVTSRDVKVGPGASQDLVFPLPGAAPVESESYDFTFTVQTYQGYKKASRHSLRFPPHTD